MTPEQEEKFETLYRLYYEYIYTYEVKHPEDFPSDDQPSYHKKDFREQLEEEGFAIKVNEGY